MARRRRARRCALVGLWTLALLAHATAGRAIIGVTSIYEQGNTVREAAARHIERVGNRAYVSFQRTSPLIPDPVSFRILDVTSPAMPTLLGWLSLPDGAWDSRVVGPLVYVAGADEGLVVVDVSSPNAPTVAGGVDTPGSAVAVELCGPFVCVADQAGGLRIFDVSTPATPVEVGAVASVGTVHDVVELSPGVVALVGGSTLWVIDVSVPAAPDVLGSTGLTGAPRTLELVDGLVYVGKGYVSSNQGLQIVDVSDPALPGVVATLAPSRHGEFFGVNGLDVHDGRAYVAVEDSDLEGALWVLDVADPAQPVEVGFFALARSSARCVRFVSQYAYACASSYDDYAVHVYDLTEPDPPDEIDALPLPDGAWDVVLGGNRAYVAAGSEGLTIVAGVLGDAGLGIVGSVDTPGEARAVAVQAGLAYVADGTGGMRIVDVSAPGPPGEIAHFATMGSATHVQVVGGIAYVTSEADGQGGVSGWQGVDVSSPAAPAELFSIPLPDPALHVLVEGDRAYVSRVQVTIYDMTDPTMPVAIDEAMGGTYFGAREVILTDALMYVVHAPSDPTTLHTLEELSPDFWAGYPYAYLGVSSDQYDVAVAAGVTYVAVPGGVRALRGPIAPGASAWPYGGDFRAIGDARLAVHGPRVVVAERGFGLRLIDLGPDFGQLAVPLPAAGPWGRVVLVAMVLAVAAAWVPWASRRGVGARGLGGR